MWPNNHTGVLFSKMGFWVRFNLNLDPKKVCFFQNLSTFTIIEHTKNSKTLNCVLGWGSIQADPLHTTHSSFEMKKSGDEFPQKVTTCS